MQANNVSRSPIVLIVNPHATAHSRRAAADVAAALGRRFSVEPVTTAEPGQATAIARDAARAGHAVVAALGGDGTLNEAANGLAGSQTALACLPGGRTNVLCQTLGLPDDPVDAVAAVIAGGERRIRVDLGTVNGRRFVFAAGLGLTAGIIGAYDRRPLLKRRLGNLYFGAAAVGTVARAYLGEPPVLRVSADGRSLMGVTAVLQNSDPLTFLGRRQIRVCAGAGLRTGTLSAALLEPSPLRALPAIIPRVTSGSASRVLAHPRVAGLARVTAIDVESGDGRAFAVEVDGDYVGDMRTASCGIEPGALTLLVPGG